MRLPKMGALGRWVNRAKRKAEALSHRSALEALSSCLENAQGLVGADLALMDPSFSGDQGVTSVVRSTAEAEVNRYETENASVMVDPAA